MRTSRRRIAAGVTAGGAALAMGMLVAPAALSAPAAPRAPLCDQAAIDAFRASHSWLAEPTNDHQVDGTVHWRSYEGGNVYCKENVTPAHEVHGAIRDTYVKTGHYQRYGVPDKDESDAANGGRHNTFVEGGTSPFSGIYWKPDLGARSIDHAIVKKWSDAGWEYSDTGYSFPTSSTLQRADGTWFNQFLNHDGAGASLFQRPTGVFDVRGAIRAKWIATGEEHYCGYPTSDEKATTTGAVSTFQFGKIVWTRSTNEVVDTCTPPA